MPSGLVTAALVAAGGALGTLVRWASGELVRRAGATLPWHTLAVNVFGCLLFGLLAELAAGRTVGGVDARLVLGTGVLGGLTTYSSFNHEVIALWSSGAWGRALGYAGATAVGCLLAGVGGLALGRALRA
ncbi:MAG: CrcB family protein [Myxococcales bacterium]|nr:CrcB family protein [Myxococcales bacterium]